MSEQQKPDTSQPVKEPPQAQATAPQPADGEKPLSAAEQKKRAKAEKQARRAAVTAQKDATGGGPAIGAAVASTSSNGEAKGPKAGAQPPPKTKQPPPQQKGQQKQHERQHSESQGAQLPVRTRKYSQSAPKEQVKKVENKNVELFSHLYQQPRLQNVDGASKDVHPSVLAFGFQISSYEICGSTARCVGMLNAFKDAIQEYTTPTGTSLNRHMSNHHLSPQIEFLKSCRPLSESMGNAIRWLKKLVGEMDPEQPDHEAKEYLCQRISQFIQERITVTDQVIASSASELIKNGSVVLTYAKSSIVEKTILKAQAEGKDFRVICIDSRPLFEGKKLATTLMQAGLQVEYLPFSGLAHAVVDATVLLLGSHSMLSNGRLQSRIGTASVAMAARRADIPVIVCCESIKFTDKVALDSVALNEVAPPEELLSPAPPTPTPLPVKGGRDEDKDIDEPKLKTLHDWRDIPHLQILNLMYDVTPAEYIDVVICEYGKVPPSSVPVVHRSANEGEQAV